MPTFEIDCEIEGRAVVTVEAETEEEARMLFHRYEGVTESGIVEWSATGNINSIKEED